MNDQRPKQLYGPEEMRAEHRACVDYHTSLVNIRFTVAGLYVAANGFLIGAVFNPDIIIREYHLVISLLACWLTLCAWILELRSRALFTNLALRGIEIERKYWGLVGFDLMAGFFSRQYKLPADDLSSELSTTAWRRKEPDRPVIAWFPAKPLPTRYAKWVSHSMGLDLLFGGGLFFWLCLSLIKFVQVVTEIIS